MSTFEWVAVAIVTVLSSARLTRLATVDKFPPIKWLREKYENKTDGTDWQMLTLCGYCFSFWATALVLLTGYLSGWQGTWGTVWWLVNGTFGASYAAAVFMAYDGDMNNAGDSAGGNAGWGTD